jgi:hypothetical protein
MLDVLCRSADSLVINGADLWDAAAYFAPETARLLEDPPWPMAMAAPAG